MCYGVNSIIAEIVAIYDAIKDLKEADIHEDTENRLYAVFQQLDELIARDISDADVREIISSPRVKFAFEAIARFRSMYTAKLEIEKAKAIIASKTSPWTMIHEFPYFENYLQLANVEYHNAGLKPGDCVLFLGSGPLPLSLIVLCHFYGLKGIGIEENPYRAALSRQVLAKLGLSDQIEIIAGNHFTLPVASAPGLVMVAAQAEPKSEIFDHLAAVLPDNTRISYRIYEEGLRKILDISHYALPARLEEICRVKPRPPANNTVVFLRVNGGIDG